MKGKFLTMEGIDGAGKSTALRFVSGCLDRHGIGHTVTREPGGTRLGEALRDLMLHDAATPVCAEAETLLMFAARAQHLNEVIRPALARGEWVVCDRFTDATYAYQGGGRGVAEARIAALESWTQGGLRPHLTLLLDMEPAAAGRRIKAADLFERESSGFMRRVRQIYLTRRQAAPARVHLVDGAQEVPAVRARVEQVIGAFVDQVREAA